MDEKAVKSIAKAIAAAEAAKIVERRIAEFRNEVEEKLSRLGVDVETIRRVVDEVYGRLLNDVKQLLDQRIMHVLSAIDEVNNVNRDVLDIVNEVLKLEAESKERIEKLEGLLDEERIEEYLYRVLVRKGVLRKGRRRWVLPVVGLSILTAVVVGFLINPILTAVVLFIVFVILMRW